MLGLLAKLLLRFPKNLAVGIHKIFVVCTGREPRALRAGESAAWVFSRWRYVPLGWLYLSTFAGAVIAAFLFSRTAGLVTAVLTALIMSIALLYQRLSGEYLYA